MQAFEQWWEEHKNDRLPTPKDYVCDNMSDEVRACLRLNGIAVDDIELEGRVYRSFHDLEGAQRILRITLAPTATTYGGMFQIRLPATLVLGTGTATETVAPPTSPPPPAPPPPPPPPLDYDVKVFQWSDEKNVTKRVQELLKTILLPVVKNNIEVHVPHGHVKAPGADDAFRIYVWSNPYTMTKIQAPIKLWGIEVDCHDGCHPSSEGRHIMNEDGSFCVAELYDNNNLYIQYDICHYGSSREIDIFTHIIKEVVDVLQTSATGDVDWKIKSKERFTTLVVAATEQITKQLEGTAAENEKKILDAQKEITRMCLEVRTCKRRVETLNKDKAAIRTMAETEFDNLKEIEGVFKILVRGPYIDVFTDTIYCANEDTGVIHEIGKFRIQLCPTGVDAPIRWFNTIRKVNGMNAPHVDANGAACTGTAGSTFSVLIGNGEITSAVVLALKFVQSANTKDTWGKHLVDWPVHKMPDAKEVK